MVTQDEFALLVSQILTPDDAVRTQAEKVFEEMKKNPNHLITSLVMLIRSAAVEDVRQASAVLLRRLLLGELSLWYQMDAINQARTKEELLRSVESEQTHSVLTKVCDAVADLAYKLAAKGEWPELLPFMFRCATSQSEAQRECAFLIFSQLAISLGAEFFRPLAGHVLQLLQAALGDTHKVRLAGLNATASFLQVLEEPEETKQFQLLTPLMLNCLSSFLNERLEDEANKALEIFVELAEVPNFFRPQLASVTSAMITITQTSLLEETTRRYALEVLLTMCETKPVTMKRQENFLASFVPVVLNMMLELEETAEDWLNFEEPDDITNSIVAEEAIDRLALAIGGRALSPVLFCHIPVLLSSQDWKQRRAGVMAISLAGEGCRNFLKSHLKDLLGMFLPLFHDPDPQVRWACCNCVGQLCTDYGPDIQKQYHNELISALIQAMGDQIARVVARSLEAIINYSASCKRKSLNPHIDDLLRHIHGVLQHWSHVRVQETAVTALSSLADCLEEHFAKYYDLFMPYLKSIVKNARSKEHRSLRGRAMEALSLLGVSVGKQRFFSDAKELMDLMLNTPALDPDDPQVSYMETAFGRIAEVLREDFVPYLPVVMPSALTRASMKADISFVDNEDDTVDGWDYISLGDKCIGIHTSQIEEKNSALRILLCLASELKEGFFPYVEEVAKICAKELTFLYHEDVRIAATLCVSELIECAIAYLKSKQSPDRTLVNQLWLFLSDKLMDSIPAEPALEVLSVKERTFAECVSLVGQNPLTPDMLQKSVTMLQMLMKEWVGRQQENAKQLAEGEVDDDQVRRTEEEKNDDCVLVELRNCVCAVAKAYGEQFVPLFASILLPDWAALLNPSACVMHRAEAVCVFDDLVENCGSAATPLVPALLQASIQYATDSDPSLRQTAVYGIGMCAMKGGEIFASKANDALHALYSSICLPNARSDEDNNHATDNAVSSLLRIAQYQGEYVNVGEVLNTWLNNLPLTYDESEALLVNAGLCGFVESHNQYVLGENYQNLPRIVKIFAEIIGTDCVDASISARIFNILSQMNTALPPAVAEGVWSTLPVEHKQKLQAFLQSSPPPHSPSPNS